MLLTCLMMKSASAADPVVRDRSRSYVFMPRYVLGQMSVSGGVYMGRLLACRYLPILVVVATTGSVMRNGRRMLQMMRNDV